MHSRPPRRRSDSTGNSRRNAPTLSSLTLPRRSTTSAAWLSDLGRREEALQATEEAVWLYRQLPKQRLEAFLPALANSLNNLGKRLRDLGRREEALQATEEAVGHLPPTRRPTPRRLPPGPRLVAQQPRRDAERPRAAGGGAPGRRGGGRTLPPTAAERPDAFLPDLAMSLNNLGNRLSDLGRREEALQAAEEAVGLYRELAAQRPDAFLPYLATSLGAKGTVLQGMGETAGAIAAFREGVQSLKPLFLRLPEAFKPLMTRLVRDYARDVRAGRCGSGLRSPRRPATQVVGRQRRGRPDLRSRRQPSALSPTS